MIRKPNRGNRFSAVAADGAVDWDHPLTRDLRGWWTAPPGIPGAGSKLVNLVGRDYGSLVAQTPSLPIWAGGQRLGPIPGLQFDGSTQYATIPTSPRLVPTAGITVSCRFRYTGSLASYPVVMRKSDDAGPPDTAWSIALGGGGEGIIWEVRNASSTLAGATTAVLAADTDYDLFCVYDGANVIVYQWAVATNVLTTASTAQTGDISYSPDDPITIGVIGGVTATAYLNGRVDDPVIWGRGLTQQQCDAWRQLRATNFQTPDSPLRWVSTRTWFVLQSAFTLFGWEPVAPVVHRRRGTAVVGNDAPAFPAPASQADVSRGWEAAYPWKLPIRQAYPGSFDRTLFQPPAATAQNPIGWEPLYPWKLPKRPTDGGTAETTRFQPPAAIAANPLGWEPLYPWSLRRRPTDPGASDRPLDQPPASTAQNPTGWEPFYPWALKRRPTDAGTTERTLFAPPAATSANPLGWEPLYPWILRREATDRGTSEHPLNQPPAAINVNPLGWEPLSPVGLRRERTDGGVAVVIVTPLDGAATSGYPLGWEPLSPTKLPRRGIPGGPWFEEHPLNLPPPPPQLPYGWDALYPWAMPRRRIAEAGTSERSLAQPGASTAQNPVGWEPLYPWKLPKRPTDGGASDRGLIQPLAATAQNPVGWESIAPVRMPRQPRLPDPVHPVYVSAAPETAVAGGWEAIGAQTRRRVWVAPVDSYTVVVPVVLIGGGTPIFRSGILRGRIVGRGIVV